MLTFSYTIGIEDYDAYVEASFDADPDVRAQLLRTRITVGIMLCMVIAILFVSNIGPKSTGITIGCLAAVGVVLLITLLRMKHSMIAKAQRRYHKLFAQPQHAAALGPVEMTVDENGVRAIYEGGSDTREWSQIWKMVESPTTYSLYLSGNTMIFISKRGLTPETTAELDGIFGKHIPAIYKQKTKNT